jgi:cobalt-zinc-cadmium efflux system protein
MSGHHHHGHHHHHNDNQKNILLAFFLNFGFSIVEFVGGYLTNSVAIYSDALHDLGDSVALLFAYFAEKMSQRKPDKKFTFGYRRFSVLAALVNGLILLVGSTFIISEAIQRFQSPEPIHAEGVILLALLGLAVNGFAAFRMSKNSGLNSRMLMFHLLEDILGWCAVLVVSTILLFKPWYILDSILSVIIALIIINGVVKNIFEVSKILMQAFPEKFNRESVLQDLLKFEHVLDIHFIQGWSVDESNYSLSLHVKVPSDMQMRDVDTLRSKMEAYLRDQHVIYSTIQFEGEDCALR